MIRSLALVGAAALISGVVGCAAPFDTSQPFWMMSLRSPEPVQNATTGGFEIEWCPALMFDIVDPITFLPAQSTTTSAPHKMQASMFAEDEDIYTLTPPLPNPQLWANPATPTFVFDIGPTGVAYEKKAQEYAINAQTASTTTSPLLVNVTRRIVDGKAVSETELSLTVDYELDCGDSGEITNGDQTCACETTRLIWDVVGGGT